jgi:hypothetical protein
MKNTKVRAYNGHIFLPLHCVSSGRFVPALSALLSDASRQMRRNQRPTLGAIGAHELKDLGVLLKNEEGHTHRTRKGGER